MPLFDIYDDVMTRVNIFQIKRAGLNIFQIKRAGLALNFEAIQPDTWASDTPLVGAFSTEELCKF